VGVDPRKCARVSCTCIAPAGEKYFSSFCKQAGAGKPRSAAMVDIKLVESSWQSHFRHGLHRAEKDFLQGYTTSTRDALPRFWLSLSATTALVKPQGGFSCQRFCLCS
jgi:hypothetical protein